MRQHHTSLIVASGLSFSGSQLSSHYSCFLPRQNQLSSVCYRSQLPLTTPFSLSLARLSVLLKLTWNFFFRSTGLAGVSSETSTAILNASPQNSPGEVKSPSAAGKNSCNMLVLRCYCCCYYYYYYYYYHHHHGRHQYHHRNRH